jgi:endonuclease/exonuclease/phosphatase (EEP) superfamily protein YafD
VRVPDVATVASVVVTHMSAPWPKPIEGWRVPPLSSVDHVFTCDCTATAVSTLTIPGSDHRALVATSRWHVFYRTRL